MKWVSLPGNRSRISPPHRATRRSCSEFHWSSAGKTSVFQCHCRIAASSSEVGGCRRCTPAAPVAGVRRSADRIARTGADRCGARTSRCAPRSTRAGRSLGSAPPAPRVLRHPGTSNAAPRRRLPATAPRPYRRRSAPTRPSTTDPHRPNHAPGGAETHALLGHDPFPARSRGGTVLTAHSAARASMAGRAEATARDRRSRTRLAGGALGGVRGCAPRAVVPIPPLLPP